MENTKKVFFVMLLFVLSMVFYLSGLFDEEVVFDECTANTKDYMSNSQIKRFNRFRTGSRRKSFIVKSFSYDLYARGYTSRLWA